jgi:type II secretory pathway component PulK
LAHRVRATVGAHAVRVWSGRRPRRAVVLVLTLWLVLVLAVLANSLGFEMEVETKLTGAFRDQFRAEQLARIGVARAVTDLRNDRLLERVEATPLTNANGTTAEPQPFDAYGDVWTGGTLLPRYYEVTRHGERGGGDERSGVEGYYEMMVVDEESKLPLTGAGPRTFDSLRYLLMELDVSEDQARDIASAIIDWQDSDDVPLNGQGGSERVAYEKLAENTGSGGRVRVSGEPAPAPDATAGKPSDTRFLPKNSPFGSVEELLQVPGITPKLFYGYDPEKQPEPDFFPVRSMGEGGRHAVGLRDLVSVRGKSLNLNTACYESLAAAFAAAANDLDTGRQLAQRLISFRQGAGTDRLDNRNAIRDISKVQQVEGFTPAILHSLGSSVPLTITSDSFTIYSRASIGRKKEVIRGSFSHAGTERPVASARIVVACNRELLVYPIQTSEDGAELPPTETMPGFRASYAGPRQGLSMRTIGTPSSGAWFVPVVYFKSWIAD